MLFIYTTLTLASAALATVSPALVDRRSYKVKDDANYTVFEHAATNTTLSYTSNRGLCETLPGIDQHSGYLTVGDNMVRNPSLCNASPSEVFSAYVVLVLRSPNWRSDRACRYVAEWRWSWLQQHGWPLPGEWALHLQQRHRTRSPLKHSQLE